MIRSHVFAEKDEVMERKLKYEVVNVIIRYSTLGENGAHDYMMSLAPPLAKELAAACDLEIAKAIERAESDAIQIKDEAGRS